MIRCMDDIARIINNSVVVLKMNLKETNKKTGNI